MAYDVDMVKAVYAALPEKVAAARKAVGRPLTLTEKILYAHLIGSAKLSTARADLAPVVLAVQKYGFLVAPRSRLVSTKRLLAC